VYRSKIGLFFIVTELHYCIYYNEHGTQRAV